MPKIADRARVAVELATPESPKAFRGVISTLACDHPDGPPEGRDCLCFCKDCYGRKRCLCKGCECSDHHADR